MVPIRQKTAHRCPRRWRLIPCGPPTLMVLTQRRRPQGIGQTRSARWHVSSWSCTREYTAKRRVLPHLPGCDLFPFDQICCVYIHWQQSSMVTTSASGPVGLAHRRTGACVLGARVWAVRRDVVGSGADGECVRVWEALRRHGQTGMVFRGARCTRRRMNAVGRERRGARGENRDGACSSGSLAHPLAGCRDHHGRLWRYRPMEAGQLPSELSHRLYPTPTAGLGLQGYPSSTIPRAAARSAPARRGLGRDRMRAVHSVRRGCPNLATGLRH